ncbi:MAG: glycosyltransferase family 4 protein [Chitinophagaceae bacterium]
MENTIIITSPSLNENINVSGISAVTKFIISNNPTSHYIHFELGKTDSQERGIAWMANIVGAYASWCKKLMRSKNIIIHFNFALEKRSILRDSPFILAARAMNKKMIIHLHGGKYLVQEPPAWIKKILKVVLTGHEPKVVLSAYEKQLIFEKFNTPDIYVLPNSVDLNEPRLFHHAYPADRPLHLLFMGRIVESKGMRYIYDACVLLKNMQVDYKFFLAGKGEEEAKYIGLFKTLLGENFVFKGVVAGKDKIALIQASDVFLLPSISGEGLPMALLESMSFGLVPVTTNDGSMAHLVNNGVTGMLVAKASAMEIADAVARLDRDRSLFQKLGENCKQHIEDHYNPENYIKELNIIYTKTR